MSSHTGDLSCGVTPDQLISAGAYIADEWGETGYRVESIHAYSYKVAGFRVACSDGGRFFVLVDRYGNRNSVQCQGYDSEAWNAPEVFNRAIEMTIEASRI